MRSLRKVHLAVLSLTSRVCDEVVVMRCCLVKLIIYCSALTPSTLIQFIMLFTFVRARKLLTSLLLSSEVFLLFFGCFSYGE
jgi:hypothetical protein